MNLPAAREVRAPKLLQRTRGALSVGVAVAACLTLLLLAGGALYLRSELRAIRGQVQTDLSTIGDLKVRQVGIWWDHRRAEAQQIFQGGLLQTPLQQFLTGSPQAPPEWDLRDWMEALQRGTYRSVILFDAQGRARISVPPESGAADAGMDASEIQEALEAQQVQVRDLHQNAGYPDIHLSLWVPLGAGKGAKARGALLLVLDPRQFLYPLIEAWPTFSASAETALVRRDGKEVQFLTNLRHRADTAMTYRIPIAGNGGLPAVQAVLGKEGLVEGPDYRGVSVFAVLRQVPRTDWHMVVKVDQAEVYGPLRDRMVGGGIGLLGVAILIGVAVGVTLRRHDARMLRRQLELSQRFEWLMREANDIILLLDEAGHILEANARAVEAYGYSLPELQTLSAGDLRAPEEESAASGSFVQVKREGSKRYETSHRHRDGSTFPVEVSARAVAIEGELRVIAFVRNITERRAQEVELVRITQLYAALSQVSQAIVWSPSQAELFRRLAEVMVESARFDMAWIAWIAWSEPRLGRITVAASHGDKQGYLQQLGVGSEQTLLAGDPVAMAIEEKCPCIANDVLAEAGSDGWRQAAKTSGFGSMAAFPIHQDGKVVGALAVYAKGKHFFGSHEAALLMEVSTDVSFALDHLVSEDLRRAAEAALRDTQRFLVEAQEAGCIGTYTWSLQEDRWKSGPFLDQIFGIGPTYIRNLEGWANLIAPDFRVHMRTYLSGIIERHERFNLDYPIIRVSDGAHRWVHGQGELRWDDQGRPVALVGIIQDITEQKRAEEERRSLESQLHQSQKLESLGSLAGGVAHDMNNVLGAILGVASSLREGADPHSSSARNLDTIMNACIRGRGVVKSLLYFAQKDLQEEGPIDLNELVREITQFLSHTTLKRIQLNVDLQEGIGFVRGDGGAISHALMNLCVNALDAMPSGGSLRIRTAPAEDGGLDLRVRDTGEGMAPAVLAKAVEPFFTTKPQGKGTGLGLAMVYGTMQAHEGSFELLSQMGEGTEAVLHFPASRVEHPPASLAATQTLLEAPQASLRILLVDDDELIRESVAPMLEMIGHSVTTAPGGAQALRFLEQGQPVDLVILDMNMPGMNGAETLPLILQARPGTPVLMSTGYSDLEMAPLLAAHPQVEAIRKPFSLVEVRRKIIGMGISGGER